MGKNKKTLTHIISGIGVGGAETFLSRLIHGMASWDHHVISLSVPQGRHLGDVFEKSAKSLTILSLKDNPLGDMVRLRGILKIQSPNLVQGWMYHGNLAASFGCLGIGGGGIPHLWNIRNGPMMGSSLGHLPLLSKTHCLVKVGAIASNHMPAKIIYNSTASSHLHASWGYAPNKSILLPNGIDTDLFAPNQAARIAIRSAWNVTENDIVIGWVGRDHPQKDIPGFCAAMTKLSQKHPAVRGVMYGIDHVDNCPDIIQLRGAESNMETIYPGFDFFCSSSIGEAFPNVLLEAMSCGVPCITTDVGDSARIVGHLGVITPPGNHDALVGALDRGVSMPTHDKNAIRNHIKQTYDLNKILKLYQDIYGELAR